MSHSIRNSLILLFLLLTVFVFFLLKNNSIKKEILVIRANVERTERELSAFGGVKPDTLRIKYMQTQIDFLENWFNVNGKMYLSKDNSQLTWKYLQDLIRQFDSGFQFNFVVNQRQERINEYNLSGRTNLTTLYRFINHLEKQAPLYTIENLQLNPSLQESDLGPVNIITFSMIIRPWTDNTAGKDLNDFSLRRIASNPLRRDPLRAQIHRPLNNPLQEKLIKHENLTLVSYTDYRAFFTNAQKQIISLDYKEKIAYGYFSHIDEINRTAVFKINKTGLFETVIIPLEKGK